MMKMLFGSDYDGTLRLAEAVDPVDLDAIRRFRAAGNLFGVVTGRDYCDAMRNIAKNLAGSLDFLICGNGAVAVLADGSLLFRHTFSGSCLSEIYELSHAFSPTAFFFDYVQTVSGNNAENITPFCGDNKDAASPAITALSYEDGVDDIRSISPEQLCCYPKVSQITICYSTHEDALMAGDYFSKRYAGVFSVKVAHTCIDIVGAGVNKDVALGCIADHFGVPRECVYTAGDGLNDIEMLTKYHGFAMTDGDPAAVAAAGRTVSSIGEALDSLL